MTIDNITDREKIKECMKILGYPVYFLEEVAIGEVVESYPCFMVDYNSGKEKVLLVKNATKKDYETFTPLTDIWQAMSVAFKRGIPILFKPFDDGQVGLDIFPRVAFEVYKYKSQEGCARAIINAVLLAKGE